MCTSHSADVLCFSFRLSDGIRGPVAKSSANASYDQTKHSRLISGVSTRSNTETHAAHLEPGIQSFRLSAIFNVGTHPPRVGVARLHGPHHSPIG